VTLVAVFGAKHSPGATTLAVALAAVAPPEEQALVIEADPAGGDLAMRAGLSLDPGLMSLAAAGRRGLTTAVLEGHAQPLGNGGRALVAPPSSEHANAALRNLAGPFASTLRARAGLTIVDVGRWDAPDKSSELLSAAQVVVAVFHPTVEGVEHTRARIRCLPVDANVVMVVVGDRPYPESEVRASLDTSFLHVVGHDSRTASVVGSGRAVDRWMRRTGYMRDVAALLAILASINTSDVVAS
jgi:hypothetical protein